MKQFFEYVPHVSDHALALIGIGLLLSVPILFGVINDYRRSPLRRKK